MRFLALLLLPSLALAEVKVVVLSARAERASERDVAGTVTQLVLDAMSKVDGVATTGEADVSAFLDDAARKQLKSCADDAACLVEVGGALGADYFLSTSLGAIGQSYVLSLRVLGAKEGAVAARASRKFPHDEEALADAVCPGVLEAFATLAAKDKRIRVDPRRCGTSKPTEPAVASVRLPAPPSTSPEAGDRPGPAAASGRSTSDPSGAGPTSGQTSKTASSSDITTRVRMRATPSGPVAVGLRGEIDLAPPLAAAVSDLRIRSASPGGTTGVLVRFELDRLTIAGTVLIPTVGLRVEALGDFGGGPVRPFVGGGLAVFPDAFGLRFGGGAAYRSGPWRVSVDLAYERFLARPTTFNTHPILLGAGAAYAF